MRFFGTIYFNINDSVVHLRQLVDFSLPFVWFSAKRHPIISLEEKEMIFAFITTHFYGFVVAVLGLKQRNWVITYWREMLSCHNHMQQQGHCSVETQLSHATCWGVKQIQLLCVCSNSMEIGEFERTVLYSYKNIVYVNRTGQVGPDGGARF